MKIVHINTTDNRGGAAQVAFILHKELNKISGVKSRMLVREKNTNDESIGTFGIKGWHRWLSIISAQDHTFLGGDKLLEHPWIKEADIIHLHNLHGYYFHLPILKKLVETKKVLWTLHDMWTITGHCGISTSEKPNNMGMYPCQGQFEYCPILLPRSTALEKSKIKILSSLSINYVTPSNWLKEKIEESYLQKKHIVCIPNGFDTNTFYNQKNNRKEILEELSIKSGKKIILFIASSFSDPAKGGETIKKILQDERLKDIQFIAIGNGSLPDQPNLLHFPYIKDKNRIARYYTIADIFLHPALIDNFPSVIIESLLSGTPVVAYKTGGIPEQIRPNIDGEIITLGNYEEFVKNIISSISKEFDSSEIANHAKREFSKETMTEKYLQQYKGLLN